MKKRKIYHIIWGVLMTLASLIMLTPILMMVMTSFKTMDEIRSATFSFLPEKFSWGNYIMAMSNGNWLIYFRNSICITLAAVLFSLLFNSIAGYAFARLKFKGAGVMFGLLMVGLMMPAQVTMLPTFLIMARFPLAGGNNIWGMGGNGLINTFAGLVIPLVSGS